MSVPSWVSGLPLFQWYSITGTAISSVAPSPASQGNPAAKITAWQGACLKRSNSTYIIGGAGGHDDYAGNEVDALMLETESPAWSQLRAPTIDSLLYHDPAQFCGDLRPGATHTYSNIRFINSLNRFVILGSPGLGAGLGSAAPGGWGYDFSASNSRSAVFNMSTSDWEDPDYFARVTAGGDWTAAAVVQNPLTDDIYLARYGTSWWKWTASTQLWSNVNSGVFERQYASGALDHIRGQSLFVSTYENDLGPRVRDISGTPVSVTFGGLGSSVLVFGHSNGGFGAHPGVVYDEANDNFLVFYNDDAGGGTNKIQVYRVNASTWSIDAPTITGTKPDLRTNGIHVSTQYVPNLGGIVMANSYTDDVKFLKTSVVASSSSPKAVVLR